MKQRFVKYLWIIPVSLLVLLVIVWLFLRLPGIVYTLLNLCGINSVSSETLSLLVTASLGLLFTSDNFYGLITKLLGFLIRHNHNEWLDTLYHGCEISIEVIMALPKRTILFLIYLFLIVGEFLGLVHSAKNSGMIIIYVIAVDRVGKIWPSEYQRMKIHLKKALHHL